MKQIYKHKTDGGAEYLSFKPEGKEFLSGVFARVDGGFELIRDVVPVDDVWGVIHEIEATCKRNSLNNMTPDELRKLVGDVYDSLHEIIR